MLLDVMISSNNESVFICYLSDLAVQIRFDAWSAAMNVSSNRPIAWNDSRYVPSWRFNLHCSIEHTTSAGIVCNVCHQFLRHRSHHGTWWIGKHLLAKAHIAKLNKLTESAVSESTSTTFDETAFAIMKWQGSQEITIVSSQRKFIFDS